MVRSAALVAVLVCVRPGCAGPSVHERDVEAEARAVEAWLYPVEDDTLPVLDENATLFDFLLYAAIQNPSLKAAFQDWKAALEIPAQVRSLPDPTFKYYRFIRDEDPRGMMSIRQRFAVAQKLPFIAKLVERGNAATAAAVAAWQRFEAKRLGLDYEVTRSYCEYYFIARAIELSREDIGLIAFFEKIARARFEANAARHGDVIKAQIELGEMENHVRQLTDELGLKRQHLNALLHRSLDAPIAIPTALEYDDVELNDALLIEFVKKDNPDLRVLDAAIEQAEHKKALAGWGYVPDVTLGVDYIDLDRSDEADDTMGSDPWIASIGINVPIFANRIEAGKREAEHRRVAATARRTAREVDLIDALKKGLYDYRDAERQIQLFGKTLIPMATQSLEVTQEEFEAGKASFLALIDAERKLLKFKLALERAAVTRKQRLARIEMLVGQQLPRRSAPNEPETKR